MERNDQIREMQETESTPGFRIYLLRHGQRPLDTSEPMLPQGVKESDSSIGPKLQGWHRKRHDAGLAPRLRQEDWLDIKGATVQDNSLSVEGIRQAHDFPKNHNILNQVLSDFPRGKIRIKFYNTKAYRTTETSQVISAELSYSLKKLIENAKSADDQEKLIDLQRVIIEEPSIEGEVNEHLEESAEETKSKSKSDIDGFVSDIKNEAKGKNENVVVFAVTHADKIKNYIEARGGHTLDRDIEPTEAFVIEG